MQDPPAIVAVLPSSVVERLTSYQLEDCLEAVDADAVLCPNRRAALALRGAGTATNRVADVLSVGDERGGRPTVYDVGSVQFVLPASDDALEAIATLEGDGDLDVATETYVVSDRLSVEIRPTTLSSRLEGRAEYANALEPDRLEGSYTHVTTEAAAGYRREWDGLTVVGCGIDEDAAEPSIPILRCYPDGTITTEDERPSRLGLRAIPEVGSETARRLRDAGYRTRDDVAEARVVDLRELDGVGTGRAERIRENARAIRDGEVVRRGAESLPAADPVFVDIETDGLSPSIVWLIGVLDRRGDGYRSFCVRDPDEPGLALEAFLSWYEANAAGRPVVAYNGREFDFPVIAEHVERHCPDRRETWSDAPAFDPYRWAIRDGNAVLPGRTNRLADVAAALGREPGETGLTGAEVARRYRRFARERTSDAEPDWDRHVRYCEDDVRALATVYDAIREASRTAAPSSEGSDDGAAAETTQGTLSEF